MKIIRKAIFTMFLTATILTSCNGFMSPPRTSPTVAMETAMSFVRTEIAETQALLPTTTPLPSFLGLYGSPTTIPDPHAFIPLPTPNPDQQVYTDPEGWYSVYFPADMKPTEKPNLFSRSDGFFETGYLPEMGYMSRAINVCAWLANVESKPEESSIGWYPVDIQSYPRCSVLTKTNEGHAIKYEIFENPAADPEHRFLYIKTGINYPGANQVGTTMAWLKPIYDTKFESVLKPLSPEETSLWENTALILHNASITEYALPPEAQVGPGEKMLVEFVPDDMLPDWAAYIANSPTSTPKPVIENQLKSLGYELRVVNSDPNNYKQQLFRDNRVLFDKIFRISDIYKFSTESGSITTFIVTTFNKIGYSDFNSYIIQNDVISEWEYNHQDPGFEPILYQGEVLWLKASEDFDHIQVINSNQDVVYAFAVYTEPLNSTNSFGIWNEHWVLAARDFLILDGENLNKKLGFQEIFSWSLMDNKPVYFFRKGPRIGLSYDGNILPLEYQEVAHHYCCGFTVNNPYIVNGSAHFFGKRNGVWYYVVVKFE
ncbi:MAG: hypothetical protein HY863_16905 [Chloroflexi bacterium]|nr:hypothetical protein [Chloroflexota bacterium]